MKVLIILLFPSLCLGALRADINGDGRVDFGDFAIMAEEWLMSEYYLSFDGAGYVSLPADANLSFADGDSWTVCFWANLQLSTGIGISALGEYNTVQNYIELADDLSGVNATVIHFVCDAGTVQTWQLTKGDLYNIWRHIAVVSNGTTVTLYLDGVSQGAKTTNTSFDSINCLGGGGRVANSFQGYIDDIRIYGEELSETVVNTIYYKRNGNKAIDELFYDGWYSNCDDGSGLTVSGRIITDGAASDHNGTISDAAHVSWVAGGVPFHTQVLTKEFKEHTYYVNETSKAIQFRFRGGPFAIREFKILEPEIQSDR